MYMGKLEIKGLGSGMGANLLNTHPPLQPKACYPQGNRAGMGSELPRSQH